MACLVADHAEEVAQQVAVVHAGGEWGGGGVIGQQLLSIVMVMVVVVVFVIVSIHPHQPSPQKVTI